MAAKKIRIRQIAKSKKVQSLRKHLWKRIYKLQEAIAGKMNLEDLCFVAEDAKGKFLGGIYGYTIFSYCYLEVLLVQEDKRRQGLGTKLLKLAEKEAKKRKCRVINLTTASYQAPAFYRKNAYKIYHRIPGMPGKHQALLMEKKLR